MVQRLLRLNSRLASIITSGHTNVYSTLLLPTFRARASLAEREQPSEDLNKLFAVAKVNGKRMSRRPCDHINGIESRGAPGPSIGQTFGVMWVKATCRLMVLSFLHCHTSQPCLRDNQATSFFSIEHPVPVL